MEYIKKRKIERKKGRNKGGVGGEKADKNRIFCCRRKFRKDKRS